MALAYGEVSSRVAAAAEAFETSLSLAEGARRSVAASTRRNVVLEGPDGLLSGGGGGGGGVVGGVGGSGAAVSGGDDGKGGQVLRPPPPPFSRLAALKWEDIEGRRILLHVDLSTGVVEAGAQSGGGGIVGGVDDGSAAGSSGGPPQPFPESVRLVAEQVREMLSAKPAAVAIVSEMAPPSAAATATAAATAIAIAAAPTAASPHHSQPAAPVHLETSKDDRQHSPAPGAPESLAVLPGSGSGSASESPSCSLRPSAAAIASLLGMEVDFCDTVPDLAAVLARCGEGGGSGVAGGNNGGGDGGGGGGGGGGGRVGDGSLPAFGMVPLLMVERLSLPGVVPAPPVEEPDLSDGEEERLPDFSWGGEGALSGLHLRVEKAMSAGHEKWKTKLLLGLRLLDTLV